MSTAQLPDRPVFRNVDQDVDVDDARRTSRLATATLFVGLLSLLAILSNILLPVAALAIVMAIVSIIRISRLPALRGTLLAQLGLGCGIVAIACTVTFAKQRESYLFSTAGQHAETFLDYLSREDKYYDALELLRSEQDRQITGTDLEAYYANVDKQVASSLKDFLSEPATNLVLESKGSADWRFQRGVRIWGTYKNRYVLVEMRNEAPERGEVVHVTLQRIIGLLVEDEGAPTAHWNVYDLQVP